MQISVNGQTVLFLGETLTDLIRQQAPKTPFAVAVNTVFVPKQHYHEYILQAHDQVDIVNPVVGG